MHHIRARTVRPPRANAYRDAWAGELDAARVGRAASASPAGCTAAATTAGWSSSTCATARGILQLVFHPEDVAGGARARRSGCAPST